MQFEEGGVSRKWHWSSTGIIVLSVCSSFFPSSATPASPLNELNGGMRWLQKLFLVCSRWQKRRRMARELLGVEWGWSSTTILSPSPLSTAPSPDSSHCRLPLLDASSPGRSPPASSPSALRSVRHRETPQL